MNKVIALILAYLIGAIPFALVVGKGLKHVDVREHGSGNLGTTNTMRVLGFRMGVLVLIGDLGKGYLSAYLGYLLGGMTWGMVAGIVAVLGHVYPVYAHFKGGKGIATGGGAFLFIMPWVFLIGITVFGIVLLSSRYVSLASLSAALTVGVTATVMGYKGFILFITWIVVAFVYYTHRANMGRLIRREEARVNFGKKSH